MIEATMKLWDPFNYSKTTDLIINSQDLTEFKDAENLDYFESDLENIYSLSANSSSNDNNIEIIKKLILKSMNLGNSASIDFIEKINSEIKLLNYFKIIEYLEFYETKSTVEESLKNKYLQLFVYLSEIFNSFLYQSPFLWGENWLDSPFSNQAILENKFKANISNTCPILSNAIKKYEQVKIFFKLSEQLNRYEKLAVISGYFLISCEVSIISKDYTLATLLLHRSIEALFMYWLLDDGEIHLNNDGTINSEKYTYLSGYLKKVKLSRSVNDFENDAVESLNELRNSTKFTHGYNIISKEIFNNSFKILKPYILKDDIVNNSYSSLRTAFYMDECCYDLAYKFLERNLYFEKLY